MVALPSLWLPILLSAVIVFVASSVMHMMLKYHRSDYSKLPDEEKTMGALRSSNLTPGLYVFPFCEMKEMKSEASAEKYKRGPVGFMTIVPNGPPAMPKFLVQWFLYSVLVSFFVAYLTGHTVSAGTDYLAVFRVAGTAAFMAYGLAHLSNGIWKGQRWGATMKEVMDGLVYGLLTAGTFGWLWPR